MPEFVERPPQPSPLGSYASDLKVLRSFKETPPQTLSLARALRNGRDFVPQVQATTTRDTVDRCDRFTERSERSRRAVNQRHFPMLRLMDKRPHTSHHPEVVSSSTTAGSPRPPQRVMRTLKHCNPEAEGAQRRRRISYPTGIARGGHTHDKFPRTELKAAFEFAVQDTHHEYPPRMETKCFLPNNRHQARHDVASHYANVRETWNDDEWLGQANAASAYSPRDRALRGVVFSSRPAKRERAVPHAMPARDSGRLIAVEGGTALPQEWGAKPPFSPSSPSRARHDIETRYYLNSSLRSRTAEKKEDIRETRRRIHMNSQKFNDKLFRHFHGSARAREQQLMRENRSRSVDSRRARKRE